MNDRLNITLYRDHRTPAQNDMRGQLASIGLAAVATVVSVPYFYEHPNTETFIAGVIGFTAVPCLAGILWRHPTRSMIRITSAFLLSCPLVYLITDGLDSKYEVARDAFFLLTGMVVIFTLAAFVADRARRRRWVECLLIATGIVVAVGAVTFMIMIFMYLE